MDPKNSLMFFPFEINKIPFFMGYNAVLNKVYNIYRT